MPEPLIHFIVPFFILIMLGLKLKKAFLISSLAIIPDLDIIFHVHRSISHSVLFILIVFIPMILILKLKSKSYGDVIIATLVVLSHPIMDMFTWYTPILWPLFNKSVYIFTELTTNMNNIFALNLRFNIKLEDIVFLKTTDSDAPIFSSEAVGITLMFLIGLSTKYLSNNLRSATNILKYGIINNSIKEKNKIKKI